MYFLIDPSCLRQVPAPGEEGKALKPSAPNGAAAGALAGLALGSNESAPFVRLESKPIMSHANSHGRSWDPILPVSS